MWAVSGISSAALSGLAARLVGADPALSMLKRAAPMPAVCYVAASAERLPFAANTFDLIAVGSALHWFDRGPFLAETGRIARDDAWLVVHNHWFTERMQDQPGLTDWLHDTYLRRYPTPPRDRSWRPPQDLDSWRHVGWERYEHDDELTLDEFVTYLTTQSNLQVVIEQGTETEAQLRSWLLAELQPFFDRSSAGRFVFGGYVACHRR